MLGLKTITYFIARHLMCTANYSTVGLKLVDECSRSYMYWHVGLQKYGYCDNAVFNYFVSEYLFGWYSLRLGDHYSLGRALSQPHTYTKGCILYPRQGGFKLITFIIYA
jgi:hypothetical protein